MRAYRLAKGIFRHLAAEAFAVINADDPGSASYCGDSTARR